jgi:hypothetical protein
MCGRSYCTTACPVEKCDLLKPYSCCRVVAQAPFDTASGLLRMLLSDSSTDNAAAILEVYLFLDLLVHLIYARERKEMQIR